MNGRARAILLAFGLVTISAALVAAVSGSSAEASTAATPPSSTVTVPATSGQTVTTTWHGTILPGTHPTSSCAPPGDATADEHDITFVVPDDTYSARAASFKFSITWADATNDEILTVMAPDGTAVASSDGGSNVETVSATNLPPGTYRVLACAFLAGPVDYDGKLVITTFTDAPLASAPAQGLEFSASVASDNQRDQAEPLLEIDKAGNVYDCGPTGASNVSDYSEISTDGGDQFHLLGTPPRGQQSAGGGGDCGLAFGTEKNSQGNYQYAYTGLGPLTGFATSTSPNNGRSLASGGPFGNGNTDEGGGADRQWMTFVDADTVLLIYNQQEPRNIVVQRSDDGGLTYSPFAERAARSPRFPGPIRYVDPMPGLPDGLVYFPWDRTAADGDQVNISFSTDRGMHWRNCGVALAPGTTTYFATADHDTAGNIYIVYGESSLFHTYMVTTSAAKLTGASKPCEDPAAGTDQPSLRPDLFSTPTQVDRNSVKTSLFQWVTAGGAPGRVAVSFAGTETEGNPSSGTFDASWDIYVSQSLNALSTDPASPPTFSQVKATTHPFHYDSICLNGLGCDLAVPPGDRSMADFFSLDYNRADRKLYVTFDRTNKEPNDDLGHIASPMVVTQIGGPSIGAGTIGPVTRPVLRKSSTDPAGDAQSSYSFLGVGLVPPDGASPRTNELAADLLGVAVGPELDLVDGSTVQDGGFTATLKVADLSDLALAQTAARTGSPSLLWVFRFTNGYQDVAASARWAPGLGFTFGYNDYTTAVTPCATAPPEVNEASEKCIVYPGDQPIQGDVNQATGTIRLSVPRFLLHALSGPTGHKQRPAQVPATVGSRFYDATVFSLGNPSADITQAHQTFLYPLDNTPAMDFLLPGSTGDGGGGGGGAACKITGGGSINAGGKFSISAHGTLPPKGNTAYRDATVHFDSTSIMSVTCSGKTGKITGTGKNNGDAAQFTINVGDNVEPGSADTYQLDLEPGGTRSGTLSKGNIQVHTS
jgi:hypothetical protein